MTADPEAPSLAARLVAHDVRLSARLQGFTDVHPMLRAAAIPLARSGDGWLWLVAIALGGLGGPADARPLALRIWVAVVATALVVNVAKRLARRERPVGTWGASYRRKDPHAFPSGHGARAFLLAALAFAFGPPWLGPLAGLWATLVAASRVALGVHYLSDVVGGALLGIACGLVASGH